jgi:hypothetical protein
MEKFKMKSIDEKEIVLSNCGELDKMYSLIVKDEPFIADFGDGKAKVIVSSLLSSRVKSGDIAIRAEE